MTATVNVAHEAANEDPFLIVGNPAGARDIDVAIGKLMQTGRGFDSGRGLRKAGALVCRELLLLARVQAR